VKVRRFSLDDYHEVLSLWKRCGLEISPGDSYDEIRVKVRRDPELFLVAMDGSRVVGTCLGAWDGRRGWIYHLGVLPSHQKRGVATILVEEVERRMKRKGVLKVSAIVYRWNTKSRRLFEKLGYTHETTTMKFGKMLRRT
jgi:ribosomal protein S18 acetylase RimI-like enzyme